MRIRTITASVLAAATAVTLVGCAPADTSVEPPKAGGTQKAKAKKTSKTARIGQPAKDGKFTFTVTKVTRGPAKIGDEYFNHVPQGKFVLVRVTVRNHGDEAQSFFGDNQKLLAGSKSYSADGEASIYMKDSKSLFEEINPGNTVRGTIVYDVPKNVTPTAIELHDSAFSGGVKVNLR